MKLVKLEGLKELKCPNCGADLIITGRDTTVMTTTSPAIVLGGEKTKRD